MELLPHPLSRGFTWQDRAGPFRRLSKAQVRQFDEQGFVVLEDVFDAPTVRAVTAAIDPLEAKSEAFLRTREAGRFGIARAGEITFTTHLVLRSPLLRDFCRGPVFQELCHDLVGPDARLYWDQAVYKKPGTEKHFPWHQDNGYTFIEPQQYLTCWVALEDATTENGCPWVLPRVHRRGTLAHRTTELGMVCLDDAEGREVAAPVGAGGIVVFSSLTPHSTGANRSDRIRKSYIVQFAPDGALIYRRAEDGTVTTEPASDPGRQFPVLIAGRPPEA